MPDSTSSIILVNWVIASANIITASTLLIIWRQFHADHERSRRQNSIEMMKVWTELTAGISLSARFAFQLFENFDENQCKSLWASDSFKIDKKYEHLLILSLKEYFDDMKFQEKNSQIELTKEQVATLRFLAASYLNLLEMIFACWRHHIGDRSIIEDEFGLLISPAKDKFPYEKLRIASESYPSISEFEKALKKKYSRETGGKTIA